jgi:hypothetical protein
MFDGSSPPAWQTITRTLTITTVETWPITIGPAEDVPLAGEVVIDQDFAEVKLFYSEKKTCNTNRS